MSTTVKKRNRVTLAEKEAALLLLAKNQMNYQLTATDLNVPVSKLRKWARSSRMESVEIIDPETETPVNAIINITDIERSIDSIKDLSKKLEMATLLRLISIINRSKDVNAMTRLLDVLHKISFAESGEEGKQPTNFFAIIEKQFIQNNGTKKKVNTDPGHKPFDSRQSF